MKKILLAAVAASVLLSFDFVPSAQAQVGGVVGTIWNAQVVNRCKNRQLTQAEATRTFWFPIIEIWRSYRDCNNKKVK